MKLLIIEEIPQIAKNRILYEVKYNSKLLANYFLYKFVPLIAKYFDCM